MKTMSLVLLPGLDGTGRLFKPLIMTLPQWIHPIVVPYPTDKPYRYTQLKPLVTDAFPENSDFIILGESFSGPLAVMCACDKPTGLKGIILCASFIKNPFRFTPSWTSLFSIGPVYLLWPATIRLRAALRGGKYRQLAATALEVIQSVRSDVIAERVKAILEVNVEEELRMCEVPVLALVSLKDHLIKKHNIEDIKKVKGDVRVSEIDTLHFILQTEPEIAAQKITEFIKTIH